MRLSALILFVCFVFLAPDSYAQLRKKNKGSSYSKRSKKIEMQLLRKALKDIQYVNYEQDIKDYTELLKIDSSNMSYNFGMAMALYTNFEQPKSTFFFERAFRHAKDTIGDAYFFLASAYHLAGNFDKAEKNYKIYYSLLSRKGSELTDAEEAFLSGDIARRIEMCNNGRFIASPAAEKDTLLNKGYRYEINDVGNNVNSRFDEYDAVFDNKDSLMYFTTRREGTTGGKVDYDDKYYEDICFSTLTNNGWTLCEKLDRPINTNKHEAIINVSPDGKRIYYYKGVNQGTFYVSDYNGRTWSKPEVLLRKQEINSNAWETSFFGFSVTVAGDELFVVSDKEGGFGGRDLYVSKLKSDSTWGALQNIGQPINTAYDEEAPYLTPDGNVMYFSSSGHNSMGGFDIFTSIRKDGKWSQPKNLGLPINTPGDDIYLTFLHQSHTACYSSSGFAPDSSRDMDIYIIDFCDSIPENTIKGYAKGVYTGTVTLTEKATGKEAGKFLIENEKYVVMAKPDVNYQFKFSSPGLQMFAADITVPSQCKRYELYQQIAFYKDKDSLVFNNAFFDIAKATLNMGEHSYESFLNKTDKSKLPKYREVSAQKLLTDTLKAVISTSTDSIRHTTETTISFNNILFDFDKSIIKDNYKPDLDKVTGYLIQTNPRDKIEVAGHTDSKGPEAYNMALSKRRSNVVAIYLVKGGVEKGRMKVVGYGESTPVAPNSNPDGTDNPDGRAKNRRTEIIILSTDLGAVIDDYFEGKNVYVLKEINDLIGPAPTEDVNAQKIPATPNPGGVNSKR